jgi:hypothetical protein
MTEEFAKRHFLLQRKALGVDVQLGHLLLQRRQIGGWGRGRADRGRRAQERRDRQHGESQT